MIHVAHINYFHHRHLRSVHSHGGALIIVVLLSAAAAGLCLFSSLFSSSALFCSWSKRHHQGCVFCCYNGEGGGGGVGEAVCWRVVVVRQNGGGFGVVISFGFWCCYVHWFGDVFLCSSKGCSLLLSCFSLILHHVRRRSCVGPVGSNSAGNPKQTRTKGLGKLSPSAYVVYWIPHIVKYKTPRAFCSVIWYSNKSNLFYVGSVTIGLFAR